MMTNYRFKRETNSRKLISAKSFGVSTTLLSVIDNKYCFIIDIVKIVSHVKQPYNVTS